MIGLGSIVEIKKDLFGLEIDYKYKVYMNRNKESKLNIICVDGFAKINMILVDKTCVLNTRRKQQVFLFLIYL